MDEDMNFERERMTRGEYRAQYGATGGKKGKDRGKKDAFAKLTLVQTLVCALLLAALLISQRASPNSFNQLREGYGRIMQQDMSAKDVWAQIKDAAGFIFEPAGVIEQEQGSTQQTQEQSSAADGVSLGQGTARLNADAKNMRFSPYYTTVSATMPVQGKVSSPFGYREDPFTGELSLHTGLDIAAQAGSPVSAAFYGTVEQTGENDVAGKFILLAHSGELKTFYCHCSEIIAQEGAVIRQGETIALVGTTGVSTGPHLHFEVRIGGMRLNPEWLLYGSDV